MFRRLIPPTPTVLAVLVIAGSAIALLIGIALSPSNPDLANHIQEAVVTLLLATVVGGFAKLLIDDIARLRAQNAENARFVQAILDDLKSVYDRVERTRLLIAAHRSAKTFGDEMRDLIDARVTLINVARALHTSADGIHEDLRAPLRHAVDCMSGFLGDVIDEFRHSYKPIADMQRVYEADMTAHTDTAPSERDTEPPANPAWNRIRGLNMYSTLIRSPIDSRPPPAYQLRFIEPLDYASSTLRDQLTAVLTGHRAKSQPRRRRKNRGRRGTSEPSRTGDTDTIQWGFHVWATFDLRDGYWLRFVEAAIANFDGSTANEEGTIDLAAIPDPYLSGRWYLHEVYTSAEAFQFHTQGPYYRTFFSRIESGYDRPYDDTSGRCLRSSWNPERPEAEPTTPGFTLGPKALARLLVRPKDSDPPQELPM